ncbi:hypothetical protein Acr_15g0010120 [Actinidia rufa]|uniref:Uncharacterized protein n=1 Tax=Actinidia rufa TaxID=165716 RepID=A0A7J0FV01_9ERIC|nr:hypothetical protein Acr_15g0010120 [Actinidia rufa]
MHLRSHLLFRPSSNSPLDNRACPIANTCQAPDLEGLHYEMHGIAEQTRIMNENNALLIQHLTMNNQPHTIAPAQEEANQSHRSHRSGGHDSQSHRSTGQAHSTRSLCRRSPSLHSKRERNLILSESRSSSQTSTIDDEKTKKKKEITSP